MGLLDNYNNLQADYIPNNFNQCVEQNLNNQFAPENKTRPYIEYNERGEQIGYYWYQGDTVEFEFDLIGEITLQYDSIIYNIPNKSPTSETIGKLNQLAYNIVDKKEWKCTSINNNIYTWEEVEYSIPNWGSNYYITAEEYLKDKYIRIQLFDFRHNPIYNSQNIDKFPSERTLMDGTLVTTKASSQIIFNIDSTLSSQLGRGTYYLSLILYDENENYVDTLISQDECTLFVK